MPPRIPRSRMLRPARPATRNDVADDVFPARHVVEVDRAWHRRRRLHAGADRRRPRRRAERRQRRAQCDAGFSQNRDQPIQIEAAALEMRDKKKEATFSGNVKVVQGDTTMTSNTLVVFYDSTPAAGRGASRQYEGAPKSAPMPVRDSRSRRQLVDQAAGSARQCGRHPEGPGRDRGHRRVRHQDQSDHHARQDRADPGQERAARRPAAGGHDDRACRGSNPTPAGCRACSSPPARADRDCRRVHRPAQRSLPVTGRLK